MVGSSSSGKSLRHKFTAEEDHKLIELVARFGTQSWKKIANFMQTRTTRQCRERYVNYLSPELTNGPWTVEESRLLLKKVEDYGPCWSKISRFFPHRSDVNVKNRYSLLVSKGIAPSLKKSKQNTDKKTEITLQSFTPVDKTIQVLDDIPSLNDASWSEKIFHQDLFDQIFEVESGWL